MITLRPQDALHKAHLLRLLTEIADNSVLSQNLNFKGGTCASMLGILDRFSVDLDFDTLATSNHDELRAEFHKIFSQMELEVKDESKRVLQFFVKYQSPEGSRNTIKIDALDAIVQANIYEPKYLPEIDRTINCQSTETIVANKLVALLDRYNKNGSIAGRDVYDIHHFLLNGLRYNEQVIIERTGKTPQDFFAELLEFVQTKVTSTIIDQDLNTLLPVETFHRIRKTLKNEVLTLLNDESIRLK